MTGGDWSYLTVARDGSAELEVRRSRFLCRVARVDTEEAARAVVERARKEHADAGHHCSAFVLGPDHAVQRAHDDGEPSGTAGAPMLDVLRGHSGRGVSDVVAVVSRWFGGVLLGSGGLVRAYGDAVRAALDEVGLRERRLLETYALTADHADAGRLESELRARDVAVLGVEHAGRVTMHLGVAAGTDLEGLVAGLTAGRMTPTLSGARWVDGPPVGAGPTGDS